MTTHEQTMIALAVLLITLVAIGVLAVGYRLAVSRGQGHRARGYRGWWRQ